jgi:hypothetical protein
MLLTFLEKEIDSCELVVFRHRMKYTVIQPYFDVALDVAHQNDELRLQILRSVPRSMSYTCRCVHFILRDEILTVLRIFVQRYLPIALTKLQSRKNF